ncbi:MAG: Nramp family divalent metal transporter [Bacteroidales bacterium]|nr:Nramp family divalent metal transporter [Bacteroidales bacterium]
MKINPPPKGFAILLLIGPSVIWASEFVGSGEVILATRTGAVIGTSVIWAVIIGIFLKYWIGLSGARYTVCTGEGMIDMFARMPGPKNWAVWIVLIGQFAAGCIAIGSLATAAGVFLGNLIGISTRLSGWIVTVFAFIVAWSGRFDWLKIIMSFLVFIVLVGVFTISVRVFPGINEILNGLIPSQPVLPDWALSKLPDNNPWREVLPLIGWGAGGFASQVWYSYWVMGAGFGAAQNNEYGKEASTAELKNLDKAEGIRLKGWCRVVYSDATLALVIGIFATLGFLLAGAGILRPLRLAPEGTKAALEIASIFSTQWGKFGGLLFMLGGTAALVSTQVGQLAGWPRILADCTRICIPAFKKKMEWKWQFRLYLIFFFFSNMIIIYSLGYKPVFLIQLGAILDGLLLTPLQALWIFIGLYFVMPGFYKREVSAILKPHWIFGVLLIVAFLVFAYFCIFQLPHTI